jgi:ATP-dependent DNA helicase PIF1
MKRVLPLSLLDEENPRCKIPKTEPEIIVDDEEEEESTVAEDEEQLSTSQTKALEMVKRGSNVFITGSAGTGKSFLLKKIMAFLDGAAKPFDLTASTGVAAWHIGGSTLHSWAGIGLGDEKVEVAIEKLKKRKDKVADWRSIHVLIVDEISMIQVKYLEKLNCIAKALRNSQRAFGGIQLILIGDYFQCPSVEKKKDVKHRFPFQAPLWQELNMQSIALKENFRQANDNSFFQLLERVKVSRTTRDDENVLKKRLIVSHGNVDESSLIRLCSRRDTAEIVNKTELEKIESPSVFFKGELVNYDLYGHVIPASTTTEDDKKDRYPVDMSIELKIGAEVLLCCNMDKENGLFNGCRGRVVAFRRDMDDPLDTRSYPVVHFEHGFRTIVKPNRWETKKKKRLTSTFTQIPLLLRYAITIHRAQGLTLSRVLITMDFFEYGQGYVALSRVRALDDLFLKDVNMKRIMVSEDVIEFYTKHGLI